MAEQKVAELIEELNTFAEQRIKENRLAEAEERYKAALDVYKEWATRPDHRLTSILTTITGLVQTLEAQGKRDEAADVLEREEATITSVIQMLRQHIK